MSAANREEALRAWELAAGARDEGNFGRAAKLARKARVLCAELGSGFEAFEAEVDAAAADAPEPPVGPSPARKSPSHKSSGPSASDRATESAAVITRLLGARLSHYERISLPTSCSIAEVEKQYKRLSIQCHPDKSDNPRATDAFKSLNDARGVLSDVEKRTRYDATLGIFNQPYALPAQPAQGQTFAQGQPFAQGHPMPQGSAQGHPVPPQRQQPPQSPPPPPDPITSSPEYRSLFSLSGPQLKAHCQTLNLSSTGNKHQLATRIVLANKANKAADEAGEAKRKEELATAQAKLRREAEEVVKVNPYVREVVEETSASDLPALRRAHERASAELQKAGGLLREERLRCASLEQELQLAMGAAAATLEAALRGHAADAQRMEAERGQLHAAAAERQRKHTEELGGASSLKDELKASKADAVASRKETAAARRELASAKKDAVAVRKELALAQEAALSTSPPGSADRKRAFDKLAKRLGDPAARIIDVDSDAEADAGSPSAQRAPKAAKLSPPNPATAAQPKPPKPAAQLSRKRPDKAAAAEAAAAAASVSFSVDGGDRGSSERALAEGPGQLAKELPAGAAASVDARVTRFLGRFRLFDAAGKLAPMSLLAARSAKKDAEEEEGEGHLYMTGFVEATSGPAIPTELRRVRALRVAQADPLHSAGQPSAVLVRTKAAWYQLGQPAADYAQHYAPAAIRAQFAQLEGKAEDKAQPREQPAAAAEAALPEAAGLLASPAPEQSAAEARPAKRVRRAVADEEEEEAAARPSAPQPAAQPLPVPCAVEAAEVSAPGSPAESSRTPPSQPAPERPIAGFHTALRTLHTGSVQKAAGADEMRIREACEAYIAQNGLAFKFKIILENVAAELAMDKAAIKEEVKAVIVQIVTKCQQSRALASPAVKVAAGASPVAV